MKHFTIFDHLRVIKNGKEGEFYVEVNSVGLVRRHRPSPAARSKSVAVGETWNKRYLLSGAGSAIFSV